ncbi:MAG TPA: TIGR03435 family protein [Bryobacteraceae bacterium]|jgi:uncharacterized protein (TIGR03435 family)
MMPISRALAAQLVFISAPGVFAQGFEVASVRPSRVDSNSSSGIATGHGRLDGRNVTLKRCIMGAYGVGPNEVIGGPEWISSERFEILATTDPPVGDDATMMVMLRGLLEERFKLGLHRESRNLQAFVLEVAKGGPKLEKSDGGSARTDTRSSDSMVSIYARNADVESFARILARRMELPVINRTGLAGQYNFKVEWMPEKAMRSGGDGVSIFTALQEQLALRLRATRTKVEVLVIDHAERPSAN